LPSFLISRIQITSNYPLVKLCAGNVSHASERLLVEVILNERETTRCAGFGWRCERRSQQGELV
jgi:hypothetical protein